MIIIIIITSLSASLLVFDFSLASSLSARKPKAKKSPLKCGPNLTTQYLYTSAP